ncbi:MAG: TlpA family protein disulfide reductase [Ginsengibacter sp.]
MKNTINTLVLLLFFCIKVSAQALTKPPAQKIPQFEFFRMDGKSFTDKDLPNGKIIFFMFVDPDCDHCQHAMQSIGEKYAAFKKTAVFIVSISDPKKLNGFMTAYGSKVKGQKNVTLLQDKFGQFITKFNPVRYPSMLLYSTQHQLLDYEDNPESVFRLVNTMNKNAQ